jgi:hypothetical protein
MAPTITWFLVAIAVVGWSPEDTEDVSDSVIATGQVAKVSLRNRWKGWTSVWPDAAGIQPELLVTFVDGTVHESCWNGPRPSQLRQCQGNAANTTKTLSTSDLRCMFFEYMVVKGYSEQAYPLSNLSGSPSGYMSHTTARIKPLLAMLTMAALKGLPVELTVSGTHPDQGSMRLKQGCFDGVSICFDGTCATGSSGDSGE